MFFYRQLFRSIPFSLQNLLQNFNFRTKTSYQFHNSSYQQHNLKIKNFERSSNKREIRFSNEDFELIFIANEADQIKIFHEFSTFKKYLQISKCNLQNAERDEQRSLFRFFTELDQLDVTARNTSAFMNRNSIYLRLFYVAFYALGYFASPRSVTSF